MLDLHTFQAHSSSVSHTHFGLAPLRAAAQHSGASRTRRGCRSQGEE